MARRQVNRSRAGETIPEQVVVDSQAVDLKSSPDRQIMPS
jgi:hypothetical protein